MGEKNKIRKHATIRRGFFFFRDIYYSQCPQIFNSLMVLVCVREEVSHFFSGAVV